MHNEAQLDVNRIWRKPIALTTQSSAISNDFRVLTRNDILRLGSLFFIAFKGGPDDSGATEEQYQRKVRALFDGRYGDCIPTASFAFTQGDALTSACIVTDYEPYGCPVIAIVATSPALQRIGAASALIDSSVEALRAIGYRECCAKISAKNLASQRLFHRCGFVPSEQIA
jgi:GNAT superfamily N-acetyltransferase